MAEKQGWETPEGGVDGVELKFDAEDSLVRVEFFYPRTRGTPQGVELSVCDVRAVPSIRVVFDYDRDGWAVQKDMSCPQSNRVEWKEVAFFQSFPEG